MSSWRDRWLPHRRDSFYLNGQTKIFHHLANDGDLLKVLFSEKGNVRLDQIKRMLTTVDTPVKWPGRDAPQ